MKTESKVSADKILMYMGRSVLIIFIIILNGLHVFGQNNNEKLYNAIALGDSSIVKNLLKNGADPNYVISKGQWLKVNMLITAVTQGNIYIVKILITNGADVQWKDGFNTTALMYAASGGSIDIVELLLGSGANINDNDGQGNSVLSAAKESKNAAVIALVENKLNEKK
jgi:ankyrin repeat protein